MAKSSADRAKDIYRDHHTNFQGGWTNDDVREYGRKCIEDEKIRCHLLIASLMGATGSDPWISRAALVRVERALLHGLAAQEMTLEGTLGTDPVVVNNVMTTDPKREIQHPQEPPPWFRNVMSHVTPTDHRRVERARRYLLLVRRMMDDNLYTDEKIKQEIGAMLADLES